MSNNPPVNDIYQMDEIAEEQLEQLRAEVARLEAREREARELLHPYREEDACWCGVGGIKKCRPCRIRAWLKGGE